MAKLVEFVFQGYDGLIYGETQTRTPSVMGKINAQNRREGVQGRWMEKHLMTERELSRKASTSDVAFFTLNSLTAKHDRLDNSNGAVEIVRWARQRFQRNANA